MSASFAYITCASAEEARRIGRVLVEERLAACANMIGGMRSVYRWQGQIEEDEETILIAKTRGELMDALIARVRELHSYDVPCVVELPLARGNEDYLRWISESVGLPQDPE